MYWKYYVLKYENGKMRHVEILCTQVRKWKNEKWGNG
jgi:hypothetical protein